MDPYSWITDECKLSSHREHCRLLCSSYYGQSDSDGSDSGSDGDPDSNGRIPSDIPVASTGIVMVSPPESSEDELPRGTDSLNDEDQEIFHTPPESRSTSASFDNCNDVQLAGVGASDGRDDTVSVYSDSADSRRAVDLTRDTDLGFSEAEVVMTQRSEADSSPPQKDSGVEIRVSKRGFSPIGQSSVESPAKKLKGLDFESPTTVKLGSSSSEDDTEELGEWLDNWKREINNPSDLGLEDEQNVESNAKVGEASGSTQRLTEAIDSEDKERNMECEKNNGEGSSREGNAENENGEGNSGKSNDTVEEETVQKRVLPSWATETVNRRVRAVKRVKFNQRKPSRASTGTDERVQVNEQEALGASNGDDERVEREVYEREAVGASNGDDERVERETLGASNGDDERVEVNEKETLGASNGDDERVEREALGASNGDGETVEREALGASNEDGETVERETLGASNEDDERVEVNERETLVASNGDDERVEVNERETLVASNGDDERVDVNEREALGASNGNDERVEVNERETDDVRVQVLMDLMMNSKKCDEELSLHCLSLLEVAKRKWDTISLDEW